jgi:PAS domain S-box-containing protein
MIVQTQHRARDGRLIPVEVEVNYLKYGDREFDCAFARDITERLEAERALRESQQKFQAIADFTYDWETWLGPDGNYIYMSPACERISGYTVAEFMETPQLSEAIVLPEDRELFAMHTHEHASTAEAEPLEYRITTKDGQVRWIGHVCQAVYDQDGNWTGRRGSNRDITEQKLAEENLIRNEALLRDAQEVANVGSWDYDMITDTLTWSDQTYRVYGRDPQTFEVTFANVVAHYPPGDQEAVLAAFQKSIQEQTDLVIEHRIVTGTNEIRFVLERGRTTYAEDGAPLRMVGTVADITERKQAEAERERFTTRLNTAAQIAERVGSILDPDELLRTVIPLIKEQFGLYYVHVYTLDEAAGMLNLRAGYGEAGEKMLAAGHSIPLDREASLVATAARTGESVLVQDVTANPDFLPNPLLPDTKSEVAVPAIAGGKVLGVFDVQHDEKDYFTDADLDVFQTLAVQIANAFRSAQIVEHLSLTQASIDQAPDAFFWFDADANFTDVSKTTCQVLGYTREELLSMRVFDVDPDFPAEAWAGLKEQVKAEGSIALPSRHKTKDGHIFPVEITVSYIEFGGREFYFSIAKDITERKVAEDAIRNSQQNMRTIFDSVYDAIFIHAMDGSIVDVNEQMLNLYGVTREQALTFSIAEDYSAPENPLEELSKTWADVSAGKVAVFEWKARRPNDGTQFDAQVVLRKISLQDRDVILANIRDITERKQAEEMVRESQQRFQGLVENLNDWIWEVDTNGAYTYVSPKVTDALGYQPEEMLGKTPFDFMPPDEVQRVAAIFGGLIADRVAIEALENTNLHKDGSRVIFETSGTPVYDAQGVFRGYRGADRDITDRVAAERAVRESAAQIRALLDAIPDMMFQFDKDGAFVNYKAEAGSELLVPPELFLGKTIHEVLPPALAATTAGYLKQILETGEPVLYEYQAPVGDTLHDYEARMVLSGEDQVLSLIRDITDRKQAEAEIQKRAAELQTVAKVGTAASTILDPDQLLAQVVELTKSNFDLYHAHIYLIDDSGEKLVLAAGAGEAGKQMLARGWQIAADSTTSLVARAFRTRAGVIVNDVRATPDFLPNPLLPDTRAELAVPLIVGERVLGVLDVQSDRVDRFTTEDSAIQTTLAGQIASALQNAQFVDQVARNLRETEVRLAVSQALAEAETEPQVWSALLDHAGLYPEAAVGLYAFEEEGGKKIQVTRAFNHFATDIAEEPVGTRFPADEFEVTALVAGGEQVITADIFADERMGAGMQEDARKLGYVSLAATPISVGNTIIGLIVAHSPHAGYFDEAKLDLYATLAEQGALALQAARLRDQLTTNEERLSLALESGRVGIWEFWPQRNEVYFNPTYYTMLGYEPYELPQSLETWAMLMHPDDAPRANEIVMGGIQAGENFDLQFRLKTKAGDWRWIQAYGYVTERTPEGSAARAVGTHTDITEQRLAEESLRMTRASVERSSDAFYWFDADARFINVNEATLNLLGYTREEILALSVFDVDPTFPHEAWEPLKAQLKAEGTVSFEGVNQTSGGILVPVDVVVSYLHFGEQEIYFSIARDITERKVAEAERERFTTRLNTAAQIAGQVGSILAPDELLSTVIPLIKERFGLYYVHVYTLDEATGTLNLRAGYGETGEKMLAEGHSIPLDREASLVATAARTGELVLVQDVTANPDFLPNSLLPDTKSEVAVPAIAGGKVLGVFDVQHDEKGYFTDADLNVFQTLAAQLANAFQSAELYEAVERQRALYDGILTNLPTAVFAVDSQFNLLVTNEAAQQLLGRQMTDKEGNAYVEQYDVVYYDTGKRFPEGELPLVKANTQGGQHVNNDLAVRHPDGTLVPLLINAGPLFDPSREQMGAVVTFADMTAQRQAEDALQASAARLRNIIDALPLGMHLYRLEPDGRLVFSGANPTADKLLGVDNSIFIGKSIEEAFPPLAETDVPVHYRAAAANGTAWQTEQISYDAGQIQGAFEVYAFQTSPGEMAAGFLDVTERLRAQQAIQESQQRLSLLVQQSPLAVIEWNTDFEVAQWNEAAEHIFGYTRAEALGRHAAGLIVPPEARELVNQVWQGLLTQTGGTRSTNENFTKDGRTITCEWYNTPLVDATGNLLGVASLVADITQEREAQAERERLSTVLESTGDFVGIAAPDGRALYFNRAARAMVGIPQEADISTYSIADLQAPNEMARTMNEIIPTAIREGLWSGESFVRTLAGQDIPVLMTVIAGKDAQGNLSYLANIARDITEIREAQIERERFATQLSTAAEITRQVGAILDTDALLNTVIPLLKERFNLYHTHVYLVDEAQSTLSLHAGYGNVGKIMVQQGHKITLDNPRSLVARAAREKDVVVSNDVTQDPNFMPNLLLPDTLAEVAVPFMMDERVLGVFDVQADAIDAFSESDLDVFRTLAGQIANAFRSAQLFEQQKQAEIAQREAVERIRAIFEAMTEGITVTNTMGQIEDLNEATLRLHAFKTREEVIGRSAMELFARMHWSKASRSIRQALEAGRSETDEYKMLRQDGGIFDAEMNSALLRAPDGSPAGFVSITRDISTRKQAELELQRFATQLNTAAGVASQVNSILDPQALLEEVVPLIKERFDLYHVYVYTVDPKAHNLVMRVGAGAAGRKMLEQGHAVALDQVQNLVARAAQGRQAIIVNDVTQEPGYKPNPLLPDTRAELAVPLIAVDQVLGVIDVHADTANRFTRADLDVFTTLAAQLSTAFQNAQFFAEIQKAAEQLREMDRLKSEFLANMSHELRTPLNSIIGYTQLLLMDLEDEISAESYTDMQSIDTNSKHLLNLINDILDLAKIEAGRLELHIEELEVAKLLDTVKSNNTGLFLDGVLTFDVEVEPDLPHIHADLVRITQVLNNLISNAVKFTETGGVIVRAYQQDNEVCIAIQDTGIGIAEKDLEAVFERFRQVDGSFTRRAEGTGLGLSITQLLVEKHNGRLEVQSKLGEGSTFTVRLPVAA